LKDSAEKFLAQHADPDGPHVLPDGQRVGDWRIAAFLGRGGSGEVYRVVEERRTEDTLPRQAGDGKARPLDAQHVAALKVLARDTDTARMRFVREASLLAKMDNPSFPKFLSQGEVDGRPYFVTELLEPRELPSSDKEVAHFLLSLCSGVTALHRMGYVHRDIKPGNIMWRTRGTRFCAPAVPVLIDLGLVKDVTRESDASGTSLSLVDGHVAGVGTPGYAAPEQLIGDAISPAADIHALGMLANECFGGKPPAVWGRIIDRATGSIPTRRYRNVAAFVSAIRHRYWRRNMIVGTVLFFAACGAVSAFLLPGQRHEFPHPPPVSPANPTIDEHSLPDVSERRRELVRKIKEKSMKSRAYAQKASQKIDDISIETERLSTATDKVERAVIAARLGRLQSEKDEYVRLQIAATNGIDTLQNELKAMSDSAIVPQVVK